VVFHRAAHSPLYGRVGGAPFGDRTTGEAPGAPAPRRDQAFTWSAPRPPRRRIVPRLLPGRRSTAAGQRRALPISYRIGNRRVTRRTAARSAERIALRERNFARMVISEAQVPPHDPEEEKGR